MKVPTWLKKFGVWAAKTLINAGREKIEEIIDEKRKPRPRARPAGTPGKSNE